jgi:streptogramin lyase
VTAAGAAVYGRPVRTFAVILLVLGLVPAASAARPRVTLVAAPTEVTAGTAFSLRLVVRNTRARVTVSASSAGRTVSTSAARGRATLTVPGPGDWRMTARVAGRTFALTTVPARSPGAPLRDPFRVAVAADGSLVIPNGRDHNVLRLRDGRLEVLAGNGRDGYEADGMPATSTAVGFPIDAAIGPDGDVYVVTAHRVRRIDSASGTIKTFAGTGVDGHTGDGGPAVAAQLDRAVAVAVDSAGNVFIAEYAGRIRRVDAATGRIETYAGIGREESSGDGGPASAAGIDRPHGIAIARDGTVFVADTYGNRVRRIDPSTRTITTLAAGLNVPTHVAVAADGSVYAAETQGHTIRRITLDGTATIVAGTGVARDYGDGGPAVRAGFDGVTGVAFGPDGSTYVSEVNGRRIRRIDGAGRITTVAH